LIWGAVVWFCLVTLFDNMEHWRDMWAVWFRSMDQLCTYRATRERSRWCSVSFTVCRLSV